MAIKAALEKFYQRFKTDRLTKQETVGVAFVSLLLMAIGSGWVADEWRDGLDSGWFLLAGLLFFGAGFWLAQGLANQLIAPRQDSFHRLGVNEEAEVVGESRKLIMFLSPVKNLDEVVARFKTLDWQAVCGDKDLCLKEPTDQGGNSPPKLIWQQNFRMLSHYSDNAEIEILVMCSKQAWPQFDAFYEVFEHFRLQEGFALSKVRRFNQQVEIDSLYRLSEALNDEIEKGVPDVSRHRIVVDITSGTKQCSAAATLASLANPNVYISYIDTGDESDKSKPKAYNLYNVQNESKVAMGG
jgi:hypothetical protein